jgi:predicted DNA-binding transcriptional regulator AlpA
MTTRKLRRNISRARATELQRTAIKARQADLIPEFPDTTSDEERPHKRLISKRQTCERVHLTFATIWKFIRAGKFPRPRAVGGKTMFVEDEVSAWIEALPVREYKVDAA